MWSHRFQSKKQFGSERKDTRCNHVAVLWNVCDKLHALLWWIKGGTVISPPFPPHFFVRKFLRRSKSFYRLIKNALRVGMPCRVLVLNSSLLMHCHKFIADTLDTVTIASPAKGDASDLVYDESLRPFLSLHASPERGIPIESFSHLQLSV